MTLNWSSLSNIENSLSSPASLWCLRKILFEIEWKVPHHNSGIGWSRIFSILPVISFAALLVNVTASTLWVELLSALISHAILWTKTFVLPEPAPARTNKFFDSDVTAERWASFRSSKIKDTSII